MSKGHSEDRPTLEDVLEDLSGLAETVRGRDDGVDADELRREWGDSCIFACDDYFAFLDELGCVDWNRREGRIHPDAAVDEPIEMPDGWRDEVDFEYTGRLDDIASTQAGGAESEEARSDTDDEHTETSTETHRDRNPRDDTMANSPSDGERYERLEEIGSGGLGTVYKGRHRALDRDVAIKEISGIFDIFADLERDEIIGRFEEIVQSQAQLSHPAVAQIFDLSSAGDYPFVVSEYAPNGSLRRLIEADDETGLRVALKYFVQLLHGLQAAHRRDLVHGNIKPENVLLDATGNAKLSDFGLSTLVDAAGASNQVHVGVGAVAYLAPELFDNPNAATKQSDIYALGILFYEMLTGKVPGRRSPMPSGFYDDVPEALDDIFDRMTLDDREERYDSVAQILEAFYGSDDIVDLLDRRSGVVFLRDPIEFDDRPLEAGAETLEGAPDQPPPEDRADTVRTDAAPVDGNEEPADFDEGDAEADPEEGLDEDSSDVSAEGLDEDSSDVSAEGLDEDSSDAELADESSVEEDEELDEEAAEPESDDEGEPDVEETDGEESADEDPDDSASQDDEVLDKLDEYGDMFEE